MSLWKKISHPYLKWRYFQRAKKPYLYRYKGLEIMIYPGVFSPKGTITTELFVDYLLQEDWKGRKVLELGAGSGLISFLLAQRGAEVTASDISESVVVGLNLNNDKLGKIIEIWHANMFQTLDNQYETIIINPPFFAKKASSDMEKAWFCGEDYEYFKLLFLEFTKRKVYEETILMVLSSNANIEVIISLAMAQNLTMDIIANPIKRGEQHFIFKIRNK